jgi:hypothetical protein
VLHSFPTRRSSDLGIKPHVRFRRNSSLSPLLAPLEVGYQRELLVNKEKFLTG